MGLIMTMLGLLCAVAIAAASRLLAEEVKAWMPTLTEWFIRAALRRLPVSKTKRYAEEWRGHIYELPGDISKLITAAGYVVAAGRISSIILPARKARVQVLRDRALAAGLLLPLLPLLLLIAVLIRLESPGPIFIRRKAGGSRGLGRSYLVFRTSRTSTRRKIVVVTRVGRFLCRFSVDELPFVLDVLLGRASFEAFFRPRR